MAGERLSASAGGAFKPGSNGGIAAIFVGGTVYAYACAGYGVYALLSTIL